MTTNRSWAVGAFGLVLLAGSGCARDSETWRPTAPFQAEIPLGQPDEEAARERAEIARPPTRERRLCEALGGSAKLSLVPMDGRVVVRITPVDGERAQAFGAARELERALHGPSEYAAERDDSDTGCGVVELGREVGIAEVREVAGPGQQVWFDVHLAAWPGREDLLRGRARIFVEEVQ